MGSDNLTKSTRKGTQALGMFQKAHDTLSDAIALAERAAEEHDENVAYHEAQAVHHSGKANEARDVSASHAKAQKKLAEFLP